MPYVLPFAADTELTVGAEVEAPTPTEAVNDRPDAESDHDAEIAKFLAQHLHSWSAVTAILLHLCVNF